MATQLKTIDYQIVHAIAGRIRLNIPHLQRDSSYAKNLQQLVESLSEVTDVRINSASGSLIVNYSLDVGEKVIEAELAECIQQAHGIKTRVQSSLESPKEPVAEISDNDEIANQTISSSVEQSEEPVAEISDNDEIANQTISSSVEQSEEPVAEISDNDEIANQTISPSVEQLEELVAEISDNDEIANQTISPSVEQLEEPVAEISDNDEIANQTISSSVEQLEEPVAETTRNYEIVSEAVSPSVEQLRDDSAEGIEKSTGTGLAEVSPSEPEQFATNIDLEQKLFEVGIPASYILSPLNAELDKFEAENEKKTDLQQIKLNLEASLKDGGFLINGKADGKFREPWMINPFTGKKYYTPWVAITAVGTAELEARVVDETINLHLTKLNVTGDSGKWYKLLVKYAFEYLFKNKLVAKINDALSEIDGAKIQQILFEVKKDEKLRESAQKLGLTPEKIDKLLELVEVNARVTPEHVWLHVRL